MGQLQLFVPEPLVKHRIREPLAQTVRKKVESVNKFSVQRSRQRKPQPLVMPTSAPCPPERPL